SLMARVCKTPQSPTYPSCDARKVGVPGSLSMRTSRGPEMMGVPPNICRIESDPRKRHEDRSLSVTVECAGVARAICRQFSLLTAGRPQLTTNRCCFHDSSNDRQPACASWLISIGGGGPV